MKVVFLSNYLNHHQKPFCENMNGLCEENFSFVETGNMSSERSAMGWNKESAEYVKNIAEATYDISTADAVIFGNASDEYLNFCKEHKKPIFVYIERIYKKGYQLYKLPIRMVRLWKKYTKYKKMYLLCASGYTYADFAKTRTFINKAYKWGYFPDTKKHDVDALLCNKKQNRILWCGRFIDWKHPDDAIKVAEKLAKDGYDFHMDLIGSGDMEITLKTLISEKHLEDRVSLLGSMKPEKVRENMENAGIYLFTSDFQEGWGAVLNECMNSGCAVVASHAAGSVPFLVKHKENGLVYKSEDVDDLYTKVKYLLEHPEEQKKMGTGAYHTIADLWNAEVAAERFLKFAEEINEHGCCDLYEDGPCSRAKIIKNDWFRG